MTTHTLKPWTELAKLHPDVESGSLAEAVFAIDLGAIATGDQTTPTVYRDPDAFFAATYITGDLHKLLEEVLASLAGKGHFNRVLKLRSPFGGGKSHTLASLLHAARSRKSLNLVPGCSALPDPGPVAVAVFDGEKFTAAGDKEVGNGQLIQTMWGWIAWQLGPAAFKIVQKHDAAKIAPAGDEIKAMLEAADKPVLLLLDEVLKYMERAAAVAVNDSTLQRQAKDFIQNLTVEVANSTHAVMVYSLQWSAREAMGNVALLEELDKLTSRKDQVREPLTGDEVLAVVKRRLLAAEPPPAAAAQVATEFGDVLSGFWRARADTHSAKNDAEELAVQTKSRIKAAYPFHPALIDVMNSRWTSVDGFQRTRGALRFLASCLHGLKARGGARSILGPGDIPISDPEVMRAMLKDLDPRQEYAPVITHDLTGPSARAKRIDEKLARETPALANTHPALRLGTAILAFSFGGLRRQDASEALPAGVTENELLAACISPDLDSITASAVLSELRNSCLYLHFDGVHYCFKKDPNVTKLIEDAEQEVARDGDAIRDRIKELLEERLAGRPGVIVWPETSQDVPDKDPRFLIAFLPIDFAAQPPNQQEEAARNIFSKYGEDLRKYRNGLALAIPEKKQLETLRRAVRYLMAIDRVEARRSQHRLTKDQFDQLRERKRTEDATAESAFRQLYLAVWLPRLGAGGQLALEKIEVGGRPLQATGIYERIMELLTTAGSPKIHSTLHPRKITDRLKLGEPTAPGEQPRLGVSTQDVRYAFFAFLDPPRISSENVIRKAIARGVAEGNFAYTSGTPALDSAGKFQVAPEKVLLNRVVNDDEIDLDDGFLMVPAAVPSPAPAGDAATAPDAGAAATATGTESPITGQTATGAAGTNAVRKTIRIRFAASRDQVFKSFPAIANLSDKSDGGKITISVEGQCAAGFDANWLRNAVEEPLDEANIDGLETQ